MRIVVKSWVSTTGWCRLERCSKGISRISKAQMPLVILVMVVLLKMGFWWLHVFGIAYLRANVTRAL